MPVHSTWDHQADKDLLLTIIEGGNLKSIEWQTISGLLSQKGYTFTKEACRQHYQKIRKEAKTSSGGLSAEPTPAKKRARNTSAGSTLAKRKKKAASEDEDDQGDMAPSPRKKRVQRVKKEEDLDDEQSKVEEVGSDGHLASIDEESLYY